MPKYNLFSYFTRNKKPKNRSFYKHTKTQRQKHGQMMQKKTNTFKGNTPKKRILVGKIYADWCGHCISLNSEWNAMKNMINHQMGRSLKNIDIEYVEIGDTEQNKAAGKNVDGMIAEFNAKHMSKSAEKLALDGGYPTVFKHCHGKLEYYKGPRTAKDLFTWYMAGC